MNEVLCKIKKLLDERNWTVYKLAKESGIAYSSLNSLFQNNTLPTISTLEKICYGLHISIAEFFADFTPYRMEIEYSKEEQELISSYRNLNRSSKRLLKGIIDLMEKN